MRSSTSNSEPGGRRIRPSVLLVALLVVLCLGLEGVTRLFYGRISQIKGRIDAEHAAALASGRGREGLPEVLILGNSLLLHGIDYPQLKQSLAPGIRTTRFVVELPIDYARSAAVFAGACPSGVF